MNPIDRIISGEARSSAAMVSGRSETSEVSKMRKYGGFGGSSAGIG